MGVNALVLGRKPGCRCSGSPKECEYKEEPPSWCSAHEENAGSRPCGDCVCSMPGRYSVVEGWRNMGASRSGKWVIKKIFLTLNTRMYPVMQKSSRVKTITKIMQTIKKIKNTYTYSFASVCISLDREAYPCKGEDRRPIP